MFNKIYQNKSVFMTGHTGYKGSWLTLWLKRLGAEITGYALPPPTNPSHWKSLDLDIDHYSGDIRYKDHLLSALQTAKPDIVFHLAAQSLVGTSYSSPLETWSTNLMGTANLLEACRQVSSIKAIVVITTDKVYEDQQWEWGYRESDRLGGYDPYSASKAACELLVQSYRKSFFCSSDCLLASARSGNVIGGGDWSPNRLIPDLVRALRAGSPLTVRSPHSKRPWQHVLDCLRGYLLLGQKLLEGDLRSADCWNFGPPSSDNWEVLDILKTLQAEWKEVDWMIDTSQPYHETSLLALDSSRAVNHLGWKTIWPLKKSLSKTAEWYSAWLEKGAVISEKQLEAYLHDVKALMEIDDEILQFSN